MSSREGDPVPEGTGTEPDPEKCPECRWATYWNGLLGHLTDCPVLKRWAAVRPEACPCCGTPWGDLLQGCPGTEENHKAKVADEQWFAEHPDVDERVRDLTRAEQLRWFLGSGMALTRVRLRRVFEEVPVGPVSTVTREYIRRRGLR